MTFRLGSAFFYVTSTGVLLALLKIGNLKATDGLIVFGGTLCVMLVAVPVILAQVKMFHRQRFREEWSIVCFVCLGGGYYGSALGGIIGIEATDGRVIDTVFFAFLYAFAFGVFGMILSAFGAIASLWFVWLIPWPFASLSRMNLVGLAIGGFVGGTLLSVAFLEIPPGREAIVIRVLLPAIVGASFGALARRSGE